MSPVHRLSQMGSMTTNKIDYPSMLAGYGDFGAMQRIQYNVASGSGGNFEFTNIPQTFQDLMMVAYRRDSGSATLSTNGWAINNDTSGTNYSATRLIGNGSSATSTRATNAATGSMTTAGALATSGIFTADVIHILNYANTSTFKTVLWRSASDLNGSGETSLVVTTWRSTAAVTRFLFGSSGNWAAGSTFALYGVRASAS